MKAVPKVDLNGLYIEDTITDDAFYGVVPFYSPLSEPESPIPGEELPEQMEEDEEVEPEIAGYIVGVPVPSGLYRPKFDLAAWEAKDEDAYFLTTQYWTEGLTPEEIEELTKPQPQEPTATDLLGAELTIMKLQNIQQQTIVSSMGQELVQSKLNGIQQQQTIAALGTELATTKLEIINLKGGQTA